MARAIEASELLKLRADGQKTSLGLLFPKPTSVYTARVNQATFTDPVAQITYDGGSGTLANVKIGMTMWVGSSAGAYDKGRVRLRAAPSETIFYIGENSDVIWAEDLYLTVVNEVDLWPKHLTVYGSSVFMDYNTAYSNQHDSPAPVPVLGPHTAIKLAGATVAHQRDGSGSWALDTAISAHAWTAAGPAAVGIDAVDTSTPTFTFSTAGRYLISDTITAGGVTNTGYRVTHVYESAVNDFILKDCFGDIEDGGWSFSVEMYDDAEIGSVVDKAMVILVSEDVYGNTSGSIGPLTGYENVIAVGHIDGESITRDHNNTGTVEFTVRGPQHWLKQMPSFPVGIENTGSTATAWTNFEDLTVDKGLWHFLHWRSTATACMDIPSLTGDTKNLPSAEAPGSTSLWDQITAIAYNTILARPLCDRFGRMYIEIDTQVVPSGDRSGFPTVMTVTDNDWFDLLNIERAPYRRVSQVEMSGISYDGSEATPLISKAQGKVYALYGRVESVDNLLLSSQSQLNTLSGDYFAWQNNEYPAVDLRLMQNNRFFDITPRQYAVLNMTSVQNPRELTWSSKKFIPKQVEFEHDPNAPVLTTYIELEAETTGAAAGQTIPYIPPPAIGLLPFELGDLTIPPLGPMPNINFPPVVPTDPVVPGDPDNACMETDAAANGPYPLYLEGTYSSGSFASPGTYRRSTWIDCVLRDSTYDNETTYEIKGIFQKKVGGVWVDTTDDSWYAIKAYNGAELVATGTHDAVTGDGRTRTGVFNYTGAITDIYMESNDNLRPTLVSVSMQGGLAGSMAVDSISVNYSFYGGGIFIYATSQQTDNINSVNNHLRVYLETGVTWTDRIATVTVAGSALQTGGSGPGISVLRAGYFQNLSNYNFDTVTTTYNPVVLSATISGVFTLNGATQGPWPTVSTYINGPDTEATLVMTGQFYMFLDERYRLQVTSASIYNVCPPGSEAV